MARKGRIFAEWWVGCVCGEAVPLVDHHRYATHEEEAKAQGWKRTKDQGWLCPDCVRKRLGTRATGSSTAIGAGRRCRKDRGTP